MTKPTPTPTKTPPASAIYVALILPGKEPLQAGVDLDHPEWERVLNEIFADMRLGALRYLLAEARRLAQVGSPTPPEPTAE